MRNIPAGLAAHIASGVTTLCHCWRLRRQDNVVMCFTDHDRDIVFDANIFSANAGLEGASSETSSGLSAGGSEVAGIFSSSLMTERDLHEGIYDGARVETWRVNWADPAQRVLMDISSIGEVRRSAESFTAELRSLAHELDQEHGQHYQAACAADLGDARCGVDVNLPAFSASVLVTTGAGLLVIETGAASFPDRFFDGGRMIILNGDQAGISRMIDQARLSDAGMSIRLWQRLPEALTMGTQVKLVAGCDKSFATCKSRFSNQARFRGFPHIPGNDALMSHVSSSNTRMDGGSLFR